MSIISNALPNFLKTVADSLIEPFANPIGPASPNIAGDLYSALAPPQWDSSNFAYHYFFGKGESVDLQQIGLLDDFRNSSSGTKIQQDWQTTVQNRISQKVTELSAQSTRSGSPQTTTFKMEDWYVYKQDNPLSPLFSLGGGGLTASAECKVTVNSATGEMSWSADLNYSGKDRFTEPLWFGSVGIHGDLPQSTPYDINFEWSTQTSSTPTPVDAAIYLSKHMNSQPSNTLQASHNDNANQKSFGLWVD